MHARNRTWLLGSDPVERCRQRTLPVEGGDGSTLSLDFTTGVLDPRLTFTRTTNATFINSQGLVEWADANMVAYSEILAGTPWQTNGVSNNPATITNPIGGDSARLITVNATGGSKSILASSNVVQGFTYTMRVWVRAGTGSSLSAGFFISGFQQCTLTKVSGPGTISGSGSGTVYQTITGLSTTEWTQIQLVITPSSTSQGSWYLYPNTPSGVVGDSIYLWGFQVNIGSTADPYYKTDANAYYAPRFDYDPSTLQPRGLLIEGSSVNYVLRSDVTGFPSPWSTAGTNLPTVTAGYTGGGFSPDGITYPTRLQFGVNAGGSASRLLQATTYATNPTTANPYTVSVWMKSNTAGTNYTVNIYGTTGNNLVTVTPTWQRFQVVNTSGTSLVGYIYISNESTSIAADVSIWGAQLEAGNGASSLIPTGASTGSRNEDSCVMNDITALQYSTTNGSIYWRGIINKQPTSYTTLIGFMAATDQPTYETFGNALSYFTAVRNPGNLNIGGANEVSRTYTLGSLIRYASSFDTITDPIVKVNLNGSAGSTNKSGTGNVLAATRFVIGRQPSTTYATFYPSVTITQIKYWPVTKTAAELNILTTL